MDDHCQGQRAAAMEGLGLVLRQGLGLVLRLGLGLKVLIWGKGTCLGSYKFFFKFFFFVFKFFFFLYLSSSFFHI